MRVAVVGSGIAGLGAAHLLDRAHDVTVFERDLRAGGHTHTIRHDGLALDTGFLVHNARNYPLLGRLFTELGVRTQESQMSFSVGCTACGLEYSGRRPFAQRRSLGSPHFAALLWEIGRWLRTARRSLEDADYEQHSLRGLPRRARLLEPLPAPFPRAADLRALVDRAGPRARVPGRLRDPLLRQPRDAGPAPLRLADGERRRRHLRPRPLRAARAAAPPRPRRPFAAARPGRRRADHRRRRAAALRQGRRRDARRPGAGAARGSRRGRAPRARRVRLHPQRGRPPHRRAASPPRSSRARRPGTTASATMAARRSPIR